MGAVGMARRECGVHSAAAAARAGAVAAPRRHANRSSVLNHDLGKQWSSVLNLMRACYSHADGLNVTVCRLATGSAASSLPPARTGVAAPAGRMRLRASAFWAGWQPVLITASSCSWWCACSSATAPAQVRQVGHAQLGMVALPLPVGTEPPPLQAVVASSCSSAAHLTLQALSRQAARRHGCRQVELASPVAVLEEGGCPPASSCWRSGTSPRPCMYHPAGCPLLFLGPPAWGTLAASAGTLASLPRRLRAPAFRPPTSTRVVPEPQSPQA